MADDSTSRRLLISVPSSKTELTPAWFQEVLSNAVSAKREVGLTVERIGAEYGLASEIFRCRFDNGSEPPSVVVKLWRTDTPSGTNEVFFYQTFGYATGVRVPCCFHAAVDSERRRGVLLLEDVVGATQGDCLQQSTLNQTRAIARNLAGLHSTWLHHPVLNQAQWLRSLTYWKPDATWFARRRELFLQRFGDGLDEFARSLIDRIDQTPSVASERLDSAEETLLHGDLHLDNILFKENTEPVILDWARVARGPAALDLADLLFVIIRLEDFEVGLASYIEAFQECSGKTLDATAVCVQLGGALLRRFTSFTCGLAQWQPSSQREQAMIQAHIRRATEAVRFWYKRDPDLFSFCK